MKSYLKLSALELGRRIHAGELSSEELTQACLDRIEALNPTINAFVLVDAEGALAVAREVDHLVTNGKADNLHPLAGVPLALKDNMTVRGQETTCCSKILKGWKPPYDATVVTKLKDAKVPLIGRTNMDEFAMGSSTEHSCYGPSHNPWQLDAIPGGSGGGSAAAVAAYMVPMALGSDTGGSIRQPGAVTGTVGAKPTYGYVSRYGLVAMASSLDQIGPVTRNVDDAAALQELIGGHDPFDSTSLNDCCYNLVDAVQAAHDKGVKGIRFGVIKEMMGEGFSQGVIGVYQKVIDQLRDAGAEIVEISCPTFKYALAAYYLIMPAEVSSNLARFDGIRFGIRVEPESGPVTSESVMAATREAGFGDEVKRRIILGTHVLSSGYFDAYYGSAQKVRTLVQRDFEAAFEQCDVLVSPTSPTTAFKLGSRIDDPMTMYMCDLATIPANLCGLPAMSIPVGLSEDDQMPVGFQVMAPVRKDDVMYQAAQTVMDVIGHNIADDCPAADMAGEEN
ncbi:MAG: Asp-tRNA(Asn)/Glu-tRNA(Gln) amidotransferase subunit GatA [Actinomycetaceae bacterium]|nr:Asp-tRNA(Asn)/Glu-tRNA(Gln) amidotransferase subunit GatA [Actinomycetaceae bacterium]